MINVNEILKKHLGRFDYKHAEITASVENYPTRNIDVMKGAIKEIVEEVLKEASQTASNLNSLASDLEIENFILDVAKQVNYD